MYLSCGSFLRVGEDMFRRGSGLGLPAFLLLRDHLDQDDPRTAKQLAGATGLNVASVRKHLNRLRELELVTRDDDGGWTRALAFDPAEIAQAVGTAGKGRAQTERLRRESLTRQRAVERWQRIAARQAAAVTDETNVEGGGR